MVIRAKLFHIYFSPEQWQHSKDCRAGTVKKYGFHEYGRHEMQEKFSRGSLGHVPGKFCKYALKYLDFNAVNLINSLGLICTGVKVICMT